MTPGFWESRRVLVTGHTGFKGGWLSLWLQSLGAQVFGVALPPAPGPNLYESAGIGNGMSSRMLDIRDLDGLRACLKEVKPECVFHLAAQPLVRRSYVDPVGTFSTNVMGTVNLLEALRSVASALSVVVVTSDKCYENREQERSYRESDPMGGSDPYSGSKGCAELATSAFVRSFYSSAGFPRVATARAGNVVGGGDWSADRLVPDVLRSFSQGTPVNLRYPNAVRPWQHVLEPLNGYLELAEQLAKGTLEGGGGWNFGPSESDVSTVLNVVKSLARYWGSESTFSVEPAQQLHEAGLLKLDCSKAAQHLGWKPKLDLDLALAWTVEWFQSWKNGENMESYTLGQIRRYEGLREASDRADLHLVSF